MKGQIDPVALGGDKGPAGRGAAATECARLGHLALQFVDQTGGRGGRPGEHLSPLGVPGGSAGGLGLDRAQDGQAQFRTMIGANS